MILQQTLIQRKYTTRWKHFCLRTWKKSLHLNCSVNFLDQSQSWEIFCNCTTSRLYLRRKLQNLEYNTCSQSIWTINALFVYDNFTSYTLDPMCCSRTIILNRSQWATMISLNRRECEVICNNTKTQVPVSSYSVVQPSVFLTSSWIIDLFVRTRT